MELMTASNIAVHFGGEVWPGAVCHLPAFPGEEGSPLRRPPSGPRPATHVHPRSADAEGAPGNGRELARDCFGPGDANPTNIGRPSTRGPATADPERCLATTGRNG